MASWECLPDVVFSKVLGHLDIISRIRVSLTCTSWKRAIDHPSVWKQFIYSEKIIWEKLFDTGIPVSEDDVKLFLETHKILLDFIEKYGKYFRVIRITVRGKHSSEIFQLISQTCNKVSEIHIFKGIEKEDFSFELRNSMYQFFQINNGITTVRMENVNLSQQKNDALPIHLSHASTLKRLWLVNSFQTNCLSSVMYLVNLRELAINPQQMNFSLLKHLASYSLKDLYIVSNTLMMEVFKEAMSDFQWQEIRKCGPDFRVHCFLANSRSWAQRDTFLKPSMPLKCLVYRLNVWLKNLKSISHLMRNYGYTLEMFVDYSNSRAPYAQTPPTSFSERIDWYILQIVYHCPKLNMLAVKEVLSSASLLVMAYTNKNLKGLTIREDMIEYINDLPSAVFLDENCKSLVERCWQKENLCDAMSELLGIEWKPMKEKEYIKFLQHTCSRVW